MNVCILAGGMGTRLLEETQVLPKPMVEIGGYPILWHIMNMYAAFGNKEFTLALGYKGHLIKDYFLNYHDRNCNISVDLKNGKVKAHQGHQHDWKVHCIDTGIATGTGGRLKKLSSFLGKETFMMTYGDGLCNVDLKKLLAFHRRHGRLATMVAIHPPARFGSMELKSDRVKSFKEKNQDSKDWINGGFFILEPEALKFIQDDATMFEQQPLEKLAREGQLMAWRHEGFWQCMDTLRDLRLLNKLWDDDKAPWKIW